MAMRGLCPEREGIAVRCVDLMLARTQLPCVVGNMVRDVAACYGIEAAVVVADAVVQAFEAGRAWGLHEKEVLQGLR